MVATKKYKLFRTLSIVVLGICGILYLLAYHYLIEHIEITQAIVPISTVVEAAQEIQIQATQEVTATLVSITVDDWNYQSGNVFISIEEVSSGSGKGTVATCFVADIMLTEYEFNVIRSYTYYTVHFPKNSALFVDIGKWASEHHEKLTGNGYPYHILPDDLCRESRVLAMADIYTALTEERPYREGLPVFEALRIIKRPLIRTSWMTESLWCLANMWRKSMNSAALPSRMFCLNIRILSRNDVHCSVVSSIMKSAPRCGCTTQYIEGNRNFRSYLADIHP